MEQETEPRWLTPEQRQAWIALSVTTVALPSALDAQLERDAGISHVEYQVLSWLSMRPDRTARMSQVARLANMRAPHLSRVAARLEARGWLTRRTDPTDHRATLASLTDAGWQKVVEAAPGHAAEVQRLVFDNLTPEQVTQLLDICTRIVGAARPDMRIPDGSGPPE